MAEKLKISYLDIRRIINIQGARSMRDIYDPILKLLIYIDK